MDCVTLRPSIIYIAHQSVMACGDLMPIEVMITKSSHKGIGIVGEATCACNQITWSNSDENIVLA